MTNVPPPTRREQLRRRELLLSDHPRSFRAQRWYALFLVLGFFAAPLAGLFVTGRPLVEIGWIDAFVWSTAALLLLIAVIDGSRRLRWPLLAGVMGFLIGLCMHLYVNGWWKRTDIHAVTESLLQETPLAASEANWVSLGIPDWDDDVETWCIALRALPEGLPRTARVEALSSALESALVTGGYIPEGTMQAAVDAGALTPGVARAILAAHDPFAQDPEPALAEGAQSWLWRLKKRDPGGGNDYAAACAALLLVPDLEGLRSGVDAALRNNLPLPGTTGAISSLRNALELADRYGLPETADVLRERADATLRGAWIRGRVSRETGWTSFPDDNLGLADASETHAAIEVLARSGVPTMIDLPLLRSALDARVADNRWQDRDERVLAAIDGAFMDATWPDACRRRLGGSDVFLVLLAGLAIWALIDVQRQPSSSAKMR
ncbi:MAG TPA: hypothetical protein VFY71_12500 [Planctomycetota bacterium]|nr:hypothetical protein [Planctomycetota bacterium]